MLDLVAQVIGVVSFAVIQLHIVSGERSAQAAIHLHDDNSWGHIAPIASSSLHLFPPEFLNG